MRGAVLYCPREVAFEERDAPTIIKPCEQSFGATGQWYFECDLWLLMVTLPFARHAHLSTIAIRLQYFLPTQKTFTHEYN
jgi:hypothetical protein